MVRREKEGVVRTDNYSGSNGRAKGRKEVKKWNAFSGNKNSEVKTDGQTRQREAKRKGKRNSAYPPFRELGRGRGLTTWCRVLDGLVTCPCATGP